MISPTGRLKVRGQDEYGAGAYGAPRTRNGKKRKHLGVDLLVKPKFDIVAPGIGWVERIGTCYPYDPRYHKMVLWLDEYDLRVNLLYVWPRLLQNGQFHRGDVIGVAEDLGARYPGIINHLHLEVLYDGKKVNPMGYLEAE